VHERYGIGRSGASIIRPDGYIACRSADMPTNPARILAHVLSHASSAPAR
jgi:aklavinone 12-hydroxylase